MRRKINLFLFGFIFINLAIAQDYTYTFVGDTTDVSPATQFGVCMMGGATEDDLGAEWFLNRSGGGNIVVIRASGGSGYNTYFFNDLGVTVQSVETIVFNNANAANDPFVLRRIQNAEAIWIAGGDQFIYESYWKTSTVRTLLNLHINTKQAPIGGTSAGMAILGDYYFNAANGTVTSPQALSNPFHPNVTLEEDFLIVPFLFNTITETHFNNPDRKGRLSTFIGRLATDNPGMLFGIAADEYVAICIDENGLATIFGDYPNFQDFAYFVRLNCTEDLPETMEAGTALTWTANNDALHVFRANATDDGSTTFDLTTWNSGTGGQWFNWTIDNGVLSENASSAPNCGLGMETFQPLEFSIYPNPSNAHVFVDYSGDILRISISDTQGKEVLHTTSNSIDVSQLNQGMYLVSVTTKDGSGIKKLVIRGE